MTRGRPRKPGARYPSGQIKIAPRKFEATEAMTRHRRELCERPELATTPLDCAFGNGWITLEELKIGNVYAGLCYGVGLVKRTGAAGNRLEATPGGGARFRWADLDDKEISTIWDSVFGEHVQPLRSEERDLALYGRYIRLRTAMTMQEAQEVFLVCVMDSWPQWMAQRLVGRNIELHAQAENRAMTEDELARRAKRFSSSFEEKYRILRAGLKAMASVNDVDRQSPPLDVSDKSPALN